jgi:hypothetical protein
LALGFWPLAFRPFGFLFPFKPRHPDARERARAVTSARVERRDLVFAYLNGAEFTKHHNLDLLEEAE